jgi:lipopolysaccharide heptosyltransferase II
MNTHDSFLVINPFGIGDVLFSTPLIRNLKENFPKARIYYLCNKKTNPIISSHHFIYKTFVYERDEFEALRHKSAFLWLKEFHRFIGGIRKEKIDIALDLSLNTQYGFYAWAAGIKKRFGLDYKNRCKFLNKKLKIKGYIDKHVVDYYLDTLTLLDLPIKRYGLEIYTDEESKRWADAFLRQKNIAAGELIIGIAPCGGGAFGKDAYIKRWPVDKYAALIDRLAVELKAKIFIFAGPQEKSDVEKILSSVQHKNSCFEFTAATLPQTVALVEKCSLFIGNDTGPLRFADALNKKIVALFGPVNERVYGPYPFDEKRTVVLKKDLPCRPCYNNFRLSDCKSNRRCMDDIEVEEVVKATKRLMGL